MTTNTPNYNLSELVLYFLKLGGLGFGGPVALIGYMHKDLVEKRNWISEEEYKEGLALGQLAPGPLAAQLAIFIGYVHYGILGATLAGIAFVIPSFIIVVLLGIAYKLYGGLSWMQALFYGIGAAVVGIISMSAYKLTLKSVSKINWVSIKASWLNWIIFIITILVTIITQQEELLLFISFGLLYMLVKNPPQFLKRTSSLNSFFFLNIGFWEFDKAELVKIWWFFTKAGAFVFGSGLAIVPFLHSGVVKEYGWLTENQFIDSVAVAMITPGPVVITVGFIGFLVSGFWGACTAALATFLPCYLFTVIPAPYFKKISKFKRIKSFIDGITIAVMGALVGSVIIIAIRTITDVPTLLIAISTCVCLVYVKKLQEPYLIALAGIIGIILKLQ